MNPVHDFVLFWKNYANFTGRTPRRGFWFVQLWLFLIYLALYILLALMGVALSGYYGSNLFSGLTGPSAFISLLTLLFSLAIVVPSLALTIRRLHDTGRRWYWILLPYIPSALMLIGVLILIASAGNTGSYSDIASLTSGYLIFVIIVWLVELIISIIMIVILASPTSPDAIGISTHDDIPTALSAGASAEAAMPVSAPAAGAGANPVVSPYYQTGTITGISGMYNGASFPINPGEMMVLGRDSALAHIVIDQGASRVSRKHVSLIYDPRQKLYYAHDYSSNGTFKDDGSRLPVDVDVALPSGTVISLGNAHNSFKLG
jgi:uncharacterized membrane protein YhaH (DUF805 family)